MEAKVFKLQLTCLGLVLKWLPTLTISNKLHFIDKQDDDGNTPMHIAVINHDFRMVKAMVEHNANFSIENKEGVSAQTLFDHFVINNKLDISAEAQIESKPNKCLDLVEKENEKEVIIDELMSNDLYEAVGNGEWDRLTEIMLNDDKQFLSRLPDGSNVIHLAIQGLQHYEFAEHSSNEPFPEEQFIINALKKYPVLFCQTNRFGETPLHLEVFHKMWQIRDGTLLYRMIKEELMNLKGRGELPLPPWKLKDVQGNTTLHYAAKYGNYEFAEYLIEIDANLVGELNHSKQTPLHLLCQKHFDSGNQMMMAKLLIEKDASTVYARDIEGFTPLLRAAQHLWTTDFILEIVKQHPQSIRQIDPHARNFFHHLKYFSSKEKLCEIAPQKESEILITQKDDQGHTPFDLAVQKRHFSKARLLIECCDLRGECFKTWLFHHNESSREMIDADQISFQFRNFLKLRPYPLSDRRAYVLSKEDIKEYMNTMGVVVALLATITFTAAFAVPGGYNDDTGIPNFGKKAAFQVFMVSDVVGMCSSMMVLLCLLWLTSKQYKVGISYSVKNI